MAHGGEDALQRGVGQAKVDEARTCDLDGLEELAILEMGDENICDLTGVHMCLLGAAHGHGRGPVAVGTVARALQTRIRDVLQGKLSCCDGFLQGFCHNLLNLVTHRAAPLLEKIQKYEITFYTSRS